MAEEQIPEAWIGKRVSLRHYQGNGDSKPIFCKLSAVSDRGVIVAEPPEGVIAFYPWSSVVAIKRGELEPRRGEKLVGSHPGY